MQISYSHMGSVDMEKPGRGLALFKSVGISSMILDFSSVAGVSEGTETKVPDREAVQPFVEACRSQGMTISLALMPYLRAEQEQRAEILYPLLEEAMRACAAYGILNVVVQPPRADRETVRVFWEQVRAWAVECGLHVLVKNCAGYFQGRYVRGEACHAGRTAEWLRKQNETAGTLLFGFCMDLGVCSLCGQNPYEFAAAMGDMLEAVIVGECSGEEPGALLPFTVVSRGQKRTDWLNFFRGLRAVAFDGTVVLDVKDCMGAVPYQLRAPLLRYVKGAGDYIGIQLALEQRLEQYKKRVLFGAGQMCQNYMKYYGRLYPPLFTCDNNAALWGTQVEGLLVKAPEALLKLPEDCAIFLCSVYEEEIRAQLLQMGVPNPVFRFNDEYLWRAEA